jgi:hypothetical protein
MYALQLKNKSTYTLVSSKYNSNEDPELKDADKESENTSEKETYTDKDEKQIIIENENTYVYAPPNYVYSWYTEYFFTKNQVYLINFRHISKISSRNKNNDQTITEYKIYFNNNVSVFAFKRAYTLPNNEEYKSFGILEGFKEINYNEENDKTGMAINFLKRRMEAILKETEH